MAEHYPALGQRKAGKFGNSLGWRRQRPRTASGLTLDALGLDTASRGIKIEDTRPDALVIGDIDGTDDSPDTVKKKARTLTNKIIPAGAEDLAIVWAQNLIHMNTVLNRILDGREDALRRRIVSGPIAAVEDFEYRIDEEGQYRISGNPAWGGFDLARCEELINKIGLDDFEAECQQMVERVKGSLWMKRQLADITGDRPPGPSQGWHCRRPIRWRQRGQRRSRHPRTGARIRREGLRPRRPHL